ncbi:Glucosamine inositolphosphorylceramide transferase 1 [Ancistrocladus abbreviatus]
MGSGPISARTGNGGGGGGSGGVGCCDMSPKCRCRGRLNQHCFLSPALIFFLAAFLLLGSVATLYAWLFFTPLVRMPYYVRTATGLSPPSLGCQEDNEGSWSIGVFYGDSPFSLKPIEDRNVWKDEGAAWPVANPVLTCASASDAGFPSNFVADPFLYIQDDTFYVFYETKNSITLQGDIAVAKSKDKGATWQQLGMALDEDWHLSFPYVFNYHDQVYMMPESSEKGEVRLYQAINFPLQWKLERVILKKPFVDSFIIEHDSKFWLFGSDHSGFDSRKNGQLEIWYSSSPLGPWKPHKKNPICNSDRTIGARNAGRPFVYDGFLHRVGQDCGETYGKRIHIFKVEVLTEDEYREVEVHTDFQESKKRQNAWNGVRHHHLDVQRLSSGEWVGLMDGDRVLSGDSFRRFVLGCASVLAVDALVILLGLLLGAANYIIPLNWRPHNLGKRSDAFLAWESPNVSSSKARWFCGRLNSVPAFLRVWVKPNTFSGKLVILLIFLAGVALMCNGVRYIYGGSGADEPYPLNSHFSQFTLLTMAYDTRLWNLKMYLKHYSRCSSVREIVVVWNKGKPPMLEDFDSAVPVRIRVENLNSLNNRFHSDPSIKTRAVLELDDDIMMACDDVERGFKVWREHPDRIVGFYPRLINGSPLKYRAEKYARRHNGYNMILTGAAFMDSQLAFERYWSEEARAGRKVVDKYFNCEDVLLNYLYIC